MKVTYRWLKDFLDLRLPAETLAHKLTMAGIEVKAVVDCGGDSVFEIEITSNRPDWLSIAGLAREVSAITGRALKKKALKPLSFVKGGHYSECPVSIEDPAGCCVYTACLIEGVTVGPSPDWLKERLEMVGCRSINNVVDITNYVLFELGEPLHAFDADMLEGPSIIVRRARSSEKLATIDGQERVLDPGILVIADRKKPVALAGIMGGKESEVSGKTKNILLEAAIFDPLVIRRGRQYLGIQSEASYRFERGIDPARLEPAALRAARLILDLAGGKPVCARRSGTLRYYPKTLSFDLSKNSRILGMGISQRQARTVFTNLGFTVSAQRKGCLNVTVPSHRPDVKEEIDLTEEIARITGYDKVPVSLPRLVIQKEAVAQKDPVRFIKTILIGLGLEEVLTYSIISRETLRDLWVPSGEALQLANPLNKEQDVLRPTLIPSLTECVAYNLRQKQESVSIFEIAKTYVREGGRVQERYALAIALCGTRGIWHSRGRLQDAAGLLHLKGMTEILLGRLGVKSCSFSRQQNQSLIGIFAGSASIGFLRELPQEVLERFDIKKRQVFVAEISLDGLLCLVRDERRFVPLPRYPAITRDISVMVKEEVSAGSLRDTIVRSAGPLLEEVQVIDYYTGKQIEKGFKNITFSCRYRSLERTLTEDEVNPAHRAITEALIRETQARIR